MIKNNKQIQYIEHYIECITLSNTVQYIYNLLYMYSVYAKQAKYCIFRQNWKGNKCEIYYNFDFILPFYSI